jgi:hypothetical protein
MSLQSIGQNGAEEFFETILYAAAYNEAQEQIRGFTNDVEDEVLQDAIQSALTIISMGVVFLMIRKQEDFIQGIFNTAKGLIVIILASDFAQKAKNKILGRLKGFKALKKFGMFQKSFSERVAMAQLVLDGATSHFEAEKTTQNEGSMLSTVAQMKDNVLNKESLNLNVGSSMASRYNETLLFKLFTKSFTSNDEVIIKKILGRESASTLSIEDMNQVADFMFVKDANGNITGLAEQFFQLINGLGYLHK